MTQKYEVTFGYSLSLPQKNEQKSLGLNCFSKKSHSNYYNILYTHIQTHTEEKKLYKVKFFES